MLGRILIDVAGWVGVAALLLAYALVSARKSKGDSVAYQLLNLAGGALVLVNSFVHGAYPSVGVNVVWIVIAVFTLARRKVGQQPA